MIQMRATRKQMKPTNKMKPRTTTMREPIEKRVQKTIVKGIMDRLRPLTIAQRIDYQNLLNQGMPEEQARAIAQGVVGKSGASQEYLAAFHARAKAQMGQGQFTKLHEHARAVAGGKAKGKAVAPDAPVDAEKDATLSQVHVSVPLGSDFPKRRKPKRDAIEWLKAALAKAGDWDESKHPRDNAGRFGAGGGGPKASGKDNTHGAAKTPNLSSTEHLARASQHIQAAQRASARGDAKMADKHMATANNHVSASLKARAEENKPIRVTDKDIVHDKPQARPMRVTDKDIVRDKPQRAIRVTDKDIVHDKPASAPKPAATDKPKANTTRASSATRAPRSDATEAKKPAAQKQPRNSKAQEKRDDIEANNLGRTSSGKAIPVDTAASHSYFKDYTAQDHKDAANAHIAASDKAASDVHAKTGGGRYWVDRHSSMASGHLRQAIKVIEQQGADRERQYRESTTRKAAAPSDAEALAWAKTVMAQQQPTESPGDGEPESKALQANRLVAGMDAELANKAKNADEARALASRALNDRPEIYDGVVQHAETHGLSGICLDIGCGINRAPGFLGLDLYPFDHGVVIYDANLGLPFPDASVKLVRLVNCLHDILGPVKSPVPLLNEIQRTLMLGGQLIYEGPEALYEEGDPWPFPGLVLKDEKDATQDGGPITQTLERVPMLVPAFVGADANYTPDGSDLPANEQVALIEQRTAPAATAMAHMVKSVVSGTIPIVKADNERQVVLGEVLVPSPAVDSQGDWLTPEDIEQAAHDYMMTARIVGSEHGEAIDAVPVESYIAPQDMTFQSPSGPMTVTKGTWLMAVKVKSSEQWAKVKSGEYSGFSIGGVGERETAA
jgi:hypothetical protein